MSGTCDHCGTWSRHPCSRHDSKTAELREVATCPNATSETRKYARNSLMRQWGWNEDDE